MRRGRAGTRVDAAGSLPARQDGRKGLPTDDEMKNRVPKDVEQRQEYQGPEPKLLNESPSYLLCPLDSAVKASRKYPTPSRRFHKVLPGSVFLFIRRPWGEATGRTAPGPAPGFCFRHATDDPPTYALPRV